MLHLRMTIVTFGSLQQYADSNADHTVGQHFHQPSRHIITAIHHVKLHLTVSYVDLHGSTVSSNDRNVIIDGWTSNDWDVIISCSSEDHDGQHKISSSAVLSLDVVAK